MAGKSKIAQIQRTMDRIRVFFMLLFLGFTTLFFSCEDNRRVDIVEDKVYLLESGFNEQEMLNMDSYIHHVMVIKSGIGTQSGTVKLVVDENIVDSYNEEHGTQYQVVPSNLYEISTSDIVFNKQDYRVPFEVRMNAPAIRELQKENSEEYVIPIRAEVVSGNITKGEPEQMESLVLPHVIDPYLSFTDTGLVSGNTIVDFESPDETLIFSEVEVNFVNQWNIDFEVEVDPALVVEYNERNGTNYTSLHPEAFQIDEETLSLKAIDNDHAFKISISKQGFIDGNGNYLFGDYLIPVVLTSTDKFGVDPERRTQLIPVTFRPNRLDRSKWEIIDWNSCICEEPQYEGLGRVPENLLDGDGDTYWGSKWDEPKPFPYYFVFDMKTSHTVYQMDLHKPLSASWRGNVKSGYFEISNDGETWTRIGSWEMLENAPREHAYQVGPASGRYIKLVIEEAFTYVDQEIGPESGANVDLAEFVVWGE